MNARMSDAVAIGAVRVAAFEIPTDGPESDGTLEWSSTTLVTVEVHAGGLAGLGYTYADNAAARLVADKLAPVIDGRDAWNIAARWSDMVGAVRNLGRPGLCSMAISAVDSALWDLKAKLLGVSLARLLGACRQAIPAYGSGGFTSYSRERLCGQLAGWVERGMRCVKMKVGRCPAEDGARVREARAAIGADTGLFVDANGGYTRKQALQLSGVFADSAVGWFEEPVSSDDLEGLRLLRDRVAHGMAIAAGEYGYDLPYFRRMLEAQAVDALQADATRCAGVSGFMAAAALAESFGLPLSSHCAPTLHLPLCLAARSAVHLEYFHDHARIEGMLFDGFQEPADGLLKADVSRPGLGVEFKQADARRFVR
jgi:L-alanine-DL-glutamate epimerase-like enolase superfamily enzyme